MENRINNRDFEQFVKQNADQYRMFPSENVWEGIHDRLHKRRRWFGAGVALLLLTTAAVTWVMLTTPENKGNKFASAHFESYSNNPEKNLEKTKETIVPVINKTSEKDISSLTPEEKRNNFFLTISSVQPSSDDIVANEPVAVINESVVIRPELKDFSVPAYIDNDAAVKLAAPKNQKVTLPVKQPEVSLAQITHDVQASINAENSTKEEINTLSSELPKELNSELMSIESVTNSYVRLRKPKKVSWQMYLTPLVTYRALKENKTFIEAARTSSNIAGTQVIYYPADLDKVIFHKPDLGFNLGVSAGYPIAKNLKIVSGLQFNVNKYDIKAYQYTNEVAPVALSNDAGGTNTVYPITSYRIVGGFKAKWLRNFYFSASVPIGGELTLINRKRTSLGITGTVQPSFVLENRSYLVSTDYKNYVELPSLTRRWNINTGLEVFAGVKTGKTEWRIGPQVRYQTLSSYKETYPVKEHLFDFGLKLGVMLR